MNKKLENIGLRLIGGHAAATGSARNTDGEEDVELEITGLA